MKRKSVFLFVALALFASPVQVFAMAHPAKAGVGYQGLITGSYLNALSVRSWVTDSFGVEANGYCGKVKLEPNTDGGRSIRTDLTALGLRGFYNLVKRENSVFYVGAEYTVGSLDRDVSSPSDNSDEELDDDITIYGAFVGSEFRFSEMPELGFNFDVGYRRVDYDNDAFDILLDGVSATLGVHYYFH